jgi:hypothetical protein
VGRVGFDLDILVIAQRFYLNPPLQLTHTAHPYSSPIQPAHITFVSTEKSIVGIASSVQNPKLALSVAEVSKIQNPRDRF